MTIRKYRVRQGFTYGAFSQHQGGDIVELDDEAAKHVMDKLELAEVIQNVVPDKTPEEALSPEAPEPEDLGEVDTFSKVKKKKPGGD